MRTVKAGNAGLNRAGRFGTTGATAVNLGFDRYKQPYKWPYKQDL